MVTVTGEDRRRGSEAGDSCTGKSRTLYEGVAAVLPDWPIVRPTRDSHDLLGLLEQGVSGRTVLWLDELKNYLHPDESGNLTARYLLDLLTAPDGPPIAIVSTSWHTDLTYLRETTASGRRRIELSAIHELLSHTQNRVVSVPPAFTPDQLAQAARSPDPRMRRAARASRTEGRIAQVLGGGDTLLTAYQGRGPVQYSHEAAAMITAAAELRRIGHPNPLPRWAIEGSASAYLDPDHRIQPADWAVQALSEASRRITGVCALTPLRMASSVGLPDTYELHDYLLQDHLSRRSREVPSESLWKTLLHNKDMVADEAAFPLADEAARRGLYGTAIELAKIDPESKFYAEILKSRGDRSAIDQLRQLARNGKEPERAFADFLVDRADTASLTELGDLCWKTGSRWVNFAARDLLMRRPTDSARQEFTRIIQASFLNRWSLRTATDQVRQLREVARDSNPIAAWLYSQLILTNGTPEAIAELRDRAIQEDHISAYVLSEFLEDRGDESAETQLRDIAQFSTAGTGFLVKLLVSRADASGIRELWDLALDDNEFAQDQVLTLHLERGGWSFLASDSLASEYSFARRRIVARLVWLGSRDAMCRAWELAEGDLGLLTLLADQRAARLEDRSALRRYEGLRGRTAGRTDGPNLQFDYPPSSQAARWAGCSDISSAAMDILRAACNPLRRSNDGEEPEQDLVRVLSGRGTPEDVNELIELVNSGSRYAAKALVDHYRTKVGSGNVVGLTLHGQPDLSTDVRSID